MFDAIAMGMSCFDFGIVMEKMPGFNENGKVVSVGAYTVPLLQQA